MTFNLTEVKEFILSIFIFHVVTGPISALHNYKNQKRNRVKFLTFVINFQSRKSPVNGIEEEPIPTKINQCLI